MAVIGIDVGGTDLKSALLSFEGKLLHYARFPIPPQKRNEEVLKKIIQAVLKEQAWAGQKKWIIKGAGFGIPGIVSKQGIVHRSPHFPNWIDYPILEKLIRRLKFPIVVDNDANLAALGEGWLGAAKKLENYILLTLGTGIGGGIVIGRELFQGDSGFAGEMGHMILKKEGPLCNCGGRGCLELYASASAIQNISPFEPKKLFKMAMRGNKKARAIFEAFGESLGAGIGSVVNVLDIENIFLGGGLAEAWKMFVKALHRGLQEHSYPTTAERVRVRRAKLGNQAGVVGAAKAALDL